MTIPQAIKKAIKGGYIRRAYDSHYDAIFLDPLFWQALGKTMGFEPKKGKRKGKIYLGSPSGYALDKKIQWWQYTWHRLIDWLAEGKTIESFFEQL